MLYFTGDPHALTILQDDSLPTVSCGTCGRWQHITCHDAVDHNSGYPKRNWTTTQFTCRRCRMAPTYGVVRLQYSNPLYSVADRWGQPRPPKHSSHPYPQAMSDSRYSQQSVQDHHISYSAPQHPVQSSSAIYTRNQQHPPTPVAFAQANQHGYGSSSPGTWANGYPSMLDGQRLVDSGVYSGARTTSSLMVSYSQIYSKRVYFMTIRRVKQRLLHRIPTYLTHSHRIIGLMTCKDIIERPSCSLIIDSITRCLIIVRHSHTSPAQSGAKTQKAMLSPMGSGLPAILERLSLWHSCKSLRQIRKVH
jgi:hypothetical protein